MQKILIIRFSSFGDILQGFEIPSQIKNTDLKPQVHWVVREDFSELVQTHPQIDHVWSLSRKDGFQGLLRLAKKLRAENFTHIYDAHNNLRSRILCLFLKSFRSVDLKRRSKNRIKRFILFKLRKNFFPDPFVAINSYLEPISKWGVRIDLTERRHLKLPQVSTVKSIDVCIAPSAAWEMKRWPTEYWKKLCELLSPLQIGILGGPEDQFCEEIKGVDPTRIQNFAGKLSWTESLSLISQSKIVISGDTGTLHGADYLGIPTLAIIGPTAFGFPARSSSRIFKTELWCQPCTKDGRGKCKNGVYKKCLVDLSPFQIAESAIQALKENV